MSASIRLCLVLHNHQPIGNFDGVFEAAYRDSYLPFLEVFEPYQHLKLALHISGSLMEWLDRHHSEYVDRLASLVQAGRIEIVGGAYYEPILTMIPPRDRAGQITQYTQWLESRFQTQVGGMWIPERVWEPALTADLVNAGVQYTVLDDFHFKNAGLVEDQLTGFYVTEDQGRVLRIFPGSERLRYLIPFGQPDEVVQYLRGIAERFPHSIAVFGDDGEKFGTWPDTHHHVYQEGWLRRFFDALEENRDWLMTSTPRECMESTAPQGKIYLPDASYREMTEWALPTRQQLEYEQVASQFQDDPRWAQLRSFVRGGCWRNFKVKYPESDEMYTRMMQVSQQLEQAEREGYSGPTLDEARDHLYRGQCNCSYWHGAFGGIYLPHLRNAIYHHLIQAENLLDQVSGKPASWVQASAEDYNFDGRREVKLAGDQLIAWISPSAGGQMYELDVRSIGHNLLATLARRPESYHQKIRNHQRHQEQDVASIHDRVVFKQEGLDQHLHYDTQLRKSLIDHFYDNEITLEAIATGQAMERGDFAQGAYQTKLRRNPDRVQVHLSRQGNAWGIPLTITKGVTLQAGGNQLEIAYLIEGLSQDQPLHFAVELNFAGLPAGADDRYFYRGDERLGQLETKLDLQDVMDLSLTDRWLGIDLGLTTNRPTGFWTFPIESVSQSEGGFERVHQSVVVMPHWLVCGDEQGRWTVTLQMQVDTNQAQVNDDCREESTPAVQVVSEAELTTPRT